MANKKNKIEVKDSKLQKTCLALQLIVEVLMIICGISFTSCSIFI